MCYLDQAEVTPALVGLGAWIYSVADASYSARRMNERNGYTLAVAPAAVPAQGGARPGLAPTARF